MNNKALQSLSVQFLSRDLNRESLCFDSWIRKPVKWKIGRINPSDDNIWSKFKGKPNQVLFSFSHALRNLSIRRSIYVYKYFFLNPSFSNCFQLHQNQASWKAENLKAINFCKWVQLWGLIAVFLDTLVNSNN